MRANASEMMASVAELKENGYADRGRTTVVLPMVLWTRFLLVAAADLQTKLVAVVHLSKALGTPALLCF